MNKDDLRDQLAREAGISPADAADQLDRVIHRILKNLRRGKPFPGLGRFLPGSAPAPRPGRGKQE